MTFDLVFQDDTGSNSSGPEIVEQGSSSGDYEWEEIEIDAEKENVVQN